MAAYGGRVRIVGVGRERAGGPAKRHDRETAAEADLDSQEVADEERVLDLASFGHHPAIVHRHLLRVPSVCVGIVVVVSLLRRSRRRWCSSARTGPAIEARPRVSWALHPRLESIDATISDLMVDI